LLIEKDLLKTCRLRFEGRSAGETPKTTVRAFHWHTLPPGSGTIRNCTLAEASPNGASSKEGKKKGHEPGGNIHGELPLDQHDNALDDPEAFRFAGRICRDSQVIDAKGLRARQACRSLPSAAGRSQR
jgi:hypothetical protein